MNAKQVSITPVCLASPDQIRPPLLRHAMASITS
jgi:hypothetical protein